MPLWCKLHFSHSNPRAAWCYLSQEERCATPLAHYYPYATTVTDPLKAHRYNASLPLRCAMRLKLSGSKGGFSAAALEAAAEESFGSRRRPGPLLPTPAANGPSAPPAAIVAAQTWLQKAEDAAVSRS